MKKYIIDLKVVSVESLSDKHILIKLTDDKPLPEMCPGQFVEVKVEHEPNTMLRRPISINFVDRDRNELWLLVAMIGNGTRQLGNLQDMGAEPIFLLGARKATDLLELDEFAKIGRVCITTEDGSAGEQGFVTNHSVLQHESFDMISSCGPKPMMVSVAKYAQKANVECEVSLENMMACGLGACLCCVEKTTKGNLCVCKEGPVFNTKKLLWNL